MELTGPAGEYGQAGAKSVEMAFRDLNDAGGPHGCKLVADTRDSQSQGALAVDAANQLVQLKKVPVIIGGIISSVSIPILTSVTGPGKIVQVSPASSSPTLTTLGREGKTNGMFFRTITSDALQGTAAAKYALDQGFKKIAVIHVNNDFGVNMFTEFAQGLQGARRRDRLGHALQREAVELRRRGEPGHRRQARRALSDRDAGRRRDDRARLDLARAAPAKFLLNDGMNSPDFISSVGAKYLNDAYGTSSGTSPTASTEYFNANYKAFSGGIDPSNPAADRAYDAGAIVGLAIAAAPTQDPLAIRDAIYKVTSKDGEVDPRRQGRFRQGARSAEGRQADPLRGRHRPGLVRQIRRHHRPVPAVEDRRRQGDDGRRNVDRRRQRDQGQDRQMRLARDPFGGRQFESACRRAALAPDLEISRIVTGLWQVADMERGGRELDREAASSALLDYARAGFDTLRHGRSLRQRRADRGPLASRARRRAAGARARSPSPNGARRRGR